MAATENIGKLLISEEEEAEHRITAKYREHFQLLSDVLIAIRASLDKHGGSIPVDSLCSAVAMFLFCKLVRTCRAIRKLTGTGWGVEAEILVRSGLETLINLSYITKEDCENRAELYAEFEFVLAHDYARRVERWPGLFKDIDLKMRHKEVERHFDQVKRKYPVRDFWAGKLIKKGRLRKMAEEVQLQWYYDFVYWFGCNLAHSNARSATEYMDTSIEGRTIYMLGPSDRNTVAALSMALDLLIRSFRCVSMFFRLPEAEILSRLEAEYVRIFGKGDTPLSYSKQE